MIALCLGRRELGKTTLALSIASRVPKAIILDPRGLVPTDDPIEDLPHDGDELWARLDDPAVTRIVVQPQDDLAGSCADLARVVREWCGTATGRLAVVLDEASLLDLRAWDWVFRCGPRDRLTVVLTAHRPQDIPTTIRALADSWCIFRMTQEHDLATIGERCGEDVVRDVRRLRPREFVLWDDARGELVIYRDPRVWYVPLRDPRVDAGLGLPAGERTRPLPLLTEDES